MEASPVVHQWVLDHLSALCLMGELDKQEAERIHALFVQRFPDEVAQMKSEARRLRRILEVAAPTYPVDHAMAKLFDLEQQGDNYITESANE